MYLHNTGRAIYDSVDKGTFACNINNVFLEGEQGILIVVHIVLHSYIHNHFNKMHILYAYVLMC